MLQEVVIYSSNLISCFFSIFIIACWFKFKYLSAVRIEIERISAFIALSTIILGRALANWMTTVLLDAVTMTVTIILRAFG